MDFFANTVVKGHVKLNQLLGPIDVLSAPNNLVPVGIAHQVGYIDRGVSTSRCTSTANNLPGWSIITDGRFVPVGLTLKRQEYPTDYCTNASTKGPVKYGQLPKWIGVLDAPNRHLPIGIASEIGQTNSGLAASRCRPRPRPPKVVGDHRRSFRESRRRLNGRSTPWTTIPTHRPRGASSDSINVLSVPDKPMPTGTAKGSGRTDQNVELWRFDVIHNAHVSGSVLHLRR